MKFWIIGGEEPQDRTADWAGQSRDWSEQSFTGEPPAVGDWIRREEGDKDYLGIVRDVRPNRTPFGDWDLTVDWD